jgi:DUF4097 and DUF4098 domain-containing protein YvlB
MLQSNIRYLNIQYSVWHPAMLTGWRLRKIPEKPEFLSKISKFCNVLPTFTSIIRVVCFGYTWIILEGDTMSTSERTRRNVLMSSFTLVLLLTVCFISGCVLNFGGFAASRFEETRNMSTPFEPNGLFIVTTHNGTIKVKSSQQNKCEITAVVRASAPTDAEARELAKKVKIEFEFVGRQLTAKVTKPENLWGNRGINIDFDVNVPLQTDLQLRSYNGTVSVSDITGNVEGITHNGAVNIVEITGNIVATTHNGAINITNITGRLKAVTHNGPVNAKGVCTKLDLTTHNGQIDVECTKGGTVPDLKAVTHNGSVRIAVPADISAKVDFRTHNGSIKSAIPVPVTEVTRTRCQMQGTIGKGDGKMYLETHNGSIRIDTL